MIGRRFAPAIPIVPIVAVVGISLGLFRAPAQAANLPDNVRTALSIGPVLPQIQQYIEQHTKALASEDPMAQSAAREDLVVPVTSSPASGTTSFEFRGAYATELNRALAALAQNPDPRVRLNAAIVAARVARDAKNAALLPAATTLLKDESDATRVWALKIGEYVLPYVVEKDPNNAKPLIDAITEIGKQTRSGVMAQAVYDALMVEQPGLNDAQWRAVRAVAVPAIHEVMRARIDQYREGIPEDVQAELSVALFLTQQSVWRDQQAPRQLTTIQLMSDLISVAGKRAGDVNADQRQEIAFLLRGLGRAVHVAGNWQNLDPLRRAAQQVESLQTLASATQIKTAAESVYPALQKVPGFNGLTAPPPVSAMTSAATTKSR